MRRVLGFYRRNLDSGELRGETLSRGLLCIKEGLSNHVGQLSMVSEEDDPGGSQGHWDLKQHIHCLYCAQGQK